MGFEIKDVAQNEFMLTGSFRKKGYDWWWHSFTAVNETTGEEKAFFIEFFTINPGPKQGQPVFGQLEENRKNGIRPSYLMIEAGCWGTLRRGSSAENENNPCQLYRLFSLDDVSIHGKVSYSVQADDCYAFLPKPTPPATAPRGPRCLL